jgi:hypothetical protein
MAPATHVGRAVRRTTLLATLSVLVTLMPSPVPAHGASEPAGVAPSPLAQSTDPRAPCRAWSNDLQPPTRIRVYRTRGPAAGKVQTVNFWNYVAVVLAAEWPASMPRQTLRAGALAVKQYGWYHVVNFRGWLAPDGTCFHVMDTSMDQVYWPEQRTPDARHYQAMTATWRVSLRKPRTTGGASRLILASYRQGNNVSCGTDRDGSKLFQRSSRDCGLRGLTATQILRTYYGPVLEFVDVRQHDMLTDAGWRGDAALLSGKAGSGTSQWRIYGATASGFRAPIGGRISIEPGAVLDVVAGDVTGDGLADMVVLVANGQLGRRLLVLRSSGSGLRTPQLWARWQEARSTDGRRLLLADFDGDGLADAGVFSAAGKLGGVPRARLAVRRALAGGSFGEAQGWWLGAYDPAVNSALAGDVTGDGRADLIVRQDRGAKGLRYWVMASSRGAGLGQPRLWLERSDWQARHTREVVIDENRDGRADLLLVRRAGRESVRVLALRSRPTGGFGVSQRWQTPAGRTMRFADVTPVALHVDSDGRGDLVLFERYGTDRLRLSWLRTTVTGMVAGQPRLDSDVRWSRSRPF